MSKSPHDGAHAILSRLSDRIANFGLDEIDLRGRDVARAAFIDTLGVALAGAEFPGLSIVRAASVVDDPSGSVVIGSQRRATALDAGLLNGIAAHALDYDDGNAVQGGHPSTVLVPAILALGEEVDASADAMLAAYAAGYEVILRVARGVNPGHYRRGWHPTSTIGVLGAAAAGARLMKLDAVASGAALAIAVSMASGVKANFGTMVKSFHVGQAVRNGLLASKLAASGFTANAGALDARQGFLNVFNGAGDFSSAAIIDGLDRPLEINTGYNGIKAYPCCASTHAAIMAAIDLQQAHGVGPDQIASVRIVVDSNRMPHTDRPILHDALSGKFSLQYVTARGLKNGHVSLDHFEKAAHLDPEIVALMKRIELVTAPADWPENSFAAEVTIETRAGQRLTARADRKSPQADEAVADRAALWSKFNDCAGRMLDGAAVDRLAIVLADFPAAAGARQIAGMLIPELASNPLASAAA